MDIFADEFRPIGGRDSKPRHRELRPGGVSRGRLELCAERGWHLTAQFDIMDLGLPWEALPHNGKNRIWPLMQ